MSRQTFGIRHRVSVRVRNLLLAAVAVSSFRTRPRLATNGGCGCAPIELVIHVVRQNGNKPSGAVSAASGGLSRGVFWFYFPGRH